MSLQSRNPQHGFTLIELMIVVAIIGVLAAISISQYQDYITRSRWSDNFRAAGQLKQAIGECMQVNQQAVIAPPCTTTALLAAAGNEFLPTGTVDPTLKAGFGAVNFGTTTAGVITFTGGALTGTAACIVTLVPTVPAGAAQITWTFTNTAPAVCNRTKTGVGT